MIKSNLCLTRFYGFDVLLDAGMHDFIFAHIAIRL